MDGPARTLTNHVQRLRYKNFWALFPLHGIQRIATSPSTVGGEYCNASQSNQYSSFDVALGEATKRSYKPHQFVHQKRFSTRCDKKSAKGSPLSLFSQLLHVSNSVRSASTKRSFTSTTDTSFRPEIQAGPAKTRPQALEPISHRHRRVRP